MPPKIPNPGQGPEHKGKEELVGLGVAEGRLPSPSLSPDPVSNPSNSPETDRINKRLRTLADQEQALFLLKYEQNDTAVTNSLDNLTALAHQIAALGTGPAGSIQPNMTEIRGIVKREEAEMRTKIATKREAVIGMQKDISELINRCFAGISDVTKEIFVSLLILSILTSDNVVASTAIISVFGENSALSKLFIFLSTYVVRPFVETNLQNIESTPQLLSAGVASSVGRQSRALLAMMFTGASLYGVNNVIQSSGVAQIVSQINTLFPVVQTCVVSTATASAECANTMYNSVIDYVRTNILGQSVPAAAAQDAASVQTTTSVLENIDSQNLGSSIASILGDSQVEESQVEDSEEGLESQNRGSSQASVESTMREVFQQLVQGSSQSQNGLGTQLSDLTKLTQSQSQSQSQSQLQGTIGGRRR